MLKGIHPGPSSLPSLLLPTRSNVLLVAAVLLSLSLGAVSIAEAHTGHGLWIGCIYMVLLGAALVRFLFYPVPFAWGTRPVPWVAPLLLCLLLGLGAVDQVHLRSAERSSDPLTSSLALELPAQALLHGHNPYSVHLAHDAPISPGPGWIVLLMPLSGLRLTGLLGMVGLAATAGCLWLRAPRAAAAFVLLMLCGPLFESQAANGQDLFVLSLSCVTLLLLLERFSDSMPTVAALSGFAGVVATARLPFAALLLVPGVGLWRRNRGAGMIYLVTMPTVALLLDTGFAWWAQRSGDQFQPMHIFHRGTAAAGHVAQLAVAVLLIAAMWWVAQRMRGEVEDWLLGTWFVMTALFLPEAAKEFNQTHHDLRWEGSTYATFGLPLLAAVLSLRVAYPIWNGRSANERKIEGQAATWNGGK